MNCRKAQQLISVERDRALSSDERGYLEGHLTQCPSCRAEQITLSAALSDWRESTKAAAVPNVDRAWLDIRRAHRQSTPAASRTPAGLLRWVLPVSGVAALAVVGGLILPRSSSSTVQAVQVEQRQIARADFVEVPSNASSLVYVDDQSGWLVVWSVSDATPSGG